MIFKQKIPCYVLVFDQVDIIKRTLAFLSRYADKLDLIIIENPSDNTPEIKKMIDRYGQDGIIKRYYLFDENITGNAYGTIIEKERDLIKKSKYVIVTDGDIDSNDTGWLSEQKNVLKKHRDVFTCGISFDMSNLPLESLPESKGWVPDDMGEHADYFEAYTGVHLLLMRGKELIGFMDWKNKNKLSFVDGNMHKYCYEEIHKKWSRTKVAKARHLTWDLYQDINHPYTQFKLSKSFQNTWHHQEVSDYTVKEY